jgi:hypothetical protein
VFNGVGVTQEQYEAVVSAVSPDGPGTAPGVLFHVAGPIPDGFRVVEVWENEEAMMQFFQEKLGPVLASANISVQPDVFPVHAMTQL